MKKIMSLFLIVGMLPACLEIQSQSDSEITKACTLVGGINYVHGQVVIPEAGTGQLLDISIGSLEPQVGECAGQEVIHSTYGYYELASMNISEDSIEYAFVQGSSAFDLFFDRANQLPIAEAEAQLRIFARASCEDEPMILDSISIRVSDWQKSYPNGKTCPPEVFSGHLAPVE